MKYRERDIVRKRKRRNSPSTSTPKVSSKTQKEEERWIYAGLGGLFFLVAFLAFQNQTSGKNESGCMVGIEPLTTSDGVKVFIKKGAGTRMLNVNKEVRYQKVESDYYQRPDGMGLRVNFTVNNQGASGEGVVTRISTHPKIENDRNSIYCKW